MLCGVDESDKGREVTGRGHLPDVVLPRRKGIPVKQDAAKRTYNHFIWQNTFGVCIVDEVCSSRNDAATPWKPCRTVGPETSDSRSRHCRWRQNLYKVNNGDYLFDGQSLMTLMTWWISGKETVLGILVWFWRLPREGKGNNIEGVASWQKLSERKPACGYCLIEIESTSHLMCVGYSAASFGWRWRLTDKQGTYGNFKNNNYHHDFNLGSIHSASSKKRLMDENC